MFTAHDYTKELCKVLEDNYTSYNNGKGGYTFTIEEGKKYLKVIMHTERGSGSVHCFVDKNTGEVYKPQSWKGPAKIVRFCLLNEESRKECFERADWAGGYLYLR
jgi:hypothetical protein